MDYTKETLDLIATRWNAPKKQYEEYLDVLRGKKYICLYGSGVLGKVAYYELLDEGIKASFFCDFNKEKWGKTITDGVECVSIDALSAHKNDAFVILTSSHYYRDDIAELTKRGITDYIVYQPLQKGRVRYFQSADQGQVLSKISALMPILVDEKSRKVIHALVNGWFDASAYPAWCQQVYEGDQYFPHDYGFTTDDEVLVDCGSFDGDTIKAFLKRTGGGFTHIYSYELDSQNHNALLEYVRGLLLEISGKISAYNLGVYNTDAEISYAVNKTSSMVIEGGASSNEQIVSGRVIALSEHLGEKRITLIKMDVEGAELKALEGAREIILQQRPKLAICIYHAPEDIWEVPFYIKSLCPDYDIFIRHHTEFEYETVCYAMPRK